MKKILFVASEAVPFVKTGGLADVVGSLPKCFDQEYYDVRVMIPQISLHQRRIEKPDDVYGSLLYGLSGAKQICGNSSVCLGWYNFLFY